MLMEIVRSKSAVFPKATQWVFNDQRNAIGEIEFSPPNWFRPLIILYIETYTTGQGHSRLIIEEFIRQVGHRRFVTDEIMHEESLQKMRKMQIFDRAYIKGKVTISDPETLSQIPIVHIFQSGGLTITRCKVNLNQRALDIYNLTSIDAIFREVTARRNDLSFFSMQL